MSFRLIITVVRNFLIIIIVISKLMKLSKTNIYFLVTSNPEVSVTASDHKDPVNEYYGQTGEILKGKVSSKFFYDFLYMYGELSLF